MLTKATEKKCNKRFVGEDKDGEITQQLMSQAKQTGFGGKKPII